MIITAANPHAVKAGINTGMMLADARAVLPGLHVLDEISELPVRLLRSLAEWCLQFTPAVSIDLPDGLIFDATGCPHLWGGERKYLDDITGKLRSRGYDVRTAIADTPGGSWAVARFGTETTMVIEGGKLVEALLPLPGEALRPGEEVVASLNKLGLRQIGQFINMPRSSLLRRFGLPFLQRLDRVLGKSPDLIEPVEPPAPFLERLPCIEPIVTAKGIEIALHELLHSLCHRLRQMQLGIRRAVLKGYRVDGKVEKIEIGTHRASHHVRHLFKLFELKLGSIEPSLGIELFVLEAPEVEAHTPQQERLFEATGGLGNAGLSEFIDRIGARVGMNNIHRYLPDEHHWPERAVKSASSLSDALTTGWPSDKPRPLQLLRVPERIEVTAPIPDYPPMLFRHRGKLHHIVNADGPERIEQEWWIQGGQHRDYYRVEDEEGNRYWLFRRGHYSHHSQWFLHGFFG